MQRNGIPHGWVNTEISSFCDVVLGQSPPSSTYNETGEGLPFFQGKAEFGDLYPVPRKWCSAPKKIAEPNSILISVRAPVGPTNLCIERSCIGRGLAAVHCLGGVSDKFVLYLLRANENELADQGTGSTFDAISGSLLKSFRVPMPPLSEQSRIVAKIEELFTQLDVGVEELRKAQAQLTRYRQAVLTAAVTGELTRKWREAHNDELEPASELLVQTLKDQRISLVNRINSDKGEQNYWEPRTPETTDLPGLPSLWIWASLESVAEAVGGYAFKSKLFLEHGKHQVVKMANIKMGILDLSERPAFVDDADPEVLKKFSLRSGDLLVTLTGTRKKRDYGFVVALEQPTRSLLLNQRIARLRPYKPILPRYLQIVMQDPVYRDRFFSHETGNVGQGNVGMAAITVEPVAIAPLAEQHKIVSEFERLTSIIHALEQTIDLAFKKADRVRQSILKDAFEGKLVPQDPNDEPAELLLERIKLEHAKREAERQAEAKSNRKHSMKNRTKRTERPAA